MRAILDELSRGACSSRAVAAMQQIVKCLLADGPHEADPSLVPRRHDAIGRYSADDAITSKD